MHEGTRSSVRSWRALLLAAAPSACGCGQGAGDAPAPEWTAQKPEFLAIARELEQGGSLFFGQQTLERLQRERADETSSQDERLAAWASYCRELLYRGRVDEAIAEIQAAIDVMDADPRYDRVNTARYRLLGLAWLRKAEVENCITRHNAECCILPLEGGGQHAMRDPALRAKAAYERYLELNPGDIGVAWLLNVIAMALGEYPDGVPLRRRVPPERFESEYDIGRFVDVAPRLGLDTLDACGGVVVEDFDRDGRLDVVTSTLDPYGPLTFHVGGRGMTFEERASAARLDDQLGGLNCIGGDYDGDGDVDLLVLRGAWLKDDGRIRNSLLRNDAAVFVDVTREAGVAEPARPTQAACFGDFDDDGDLDLYVANESRLHWGETSYPSQLFVNDEGRFRDRAAEAGVTNDRYGKGVTTGDFDNDGDLDLYVSNHGENRLYENGGDGIFADVAETLGVQEPTERSFATWFFDYDNDGWLDLFVAAFQATLADVAAGYWGLPHRALLPCLYHNAGGTFTDVARDVGLARAMLPMGANFGDLDSDGFLDVFLATGDPSYETLTPNVVFRNAGGARFQDVTKSGGFGHLQKGHGVAFADLDDDGDQDVFNQLGGFYPGDAFRNALFENPGHGNRFLYVSLAGTRSNRSGVGARLAVEVERADGSRATFHRAVGSVSSFGGSPLRQEIGLGRAERIVALEVDWPRSATQRFERLELDTWVEVTEGESRPTQRELQR